MATSRPESPVNSADQADIVAQSRRLWASLPDTDPARAEGEALCTILEPLGLSPSLSAATRLYPAVRDGRLQLDQLPGPLAILSATIEDLVQLGRFALAPDWRPGEALAVSQSEALRKMLLALVSDARLVLIRIAEQLVRLREAKNGDPQTKRTVAIETREIYAPLANRLGVWQLKWELEDLAFRYLEPDTYAGIARKLNEKRIEREASIEEVRAEIAAELEAHDVEALVPGRPKHIYSIWRKMQRKGSGMEAIFDVRAVRILVGTISDCYAALGVVHNRWPYLRGEFDDYIANPKDNHYQSLHTAVIGPGGRPVEVQIRTHEMHRHDELGVAAHWRYKEGSGSEATFDRKIRLLRQLLEPTDRDSDLLDRIRGEVFEDRVYALSPKGDVVEMPAGSTPLDFAYHVHTQVGHRCRGAKVNGRIVPLTYRVQNGDKIEILTGKEPQPSRDWLSPQNGYLAASRSRAKVRNWFRQQDRDQNRRQGREMLDREVSRLNMREVATDRIAERLKLANTEALCVALGAGDVTAANIATVLQHMKHEELPARVGPRRSPRATRDGRNHIAIRGVGDLLCNLARCCRPVPPEAIVGYITQGRGVSIHRQDCRNFRNLHSRQPERVIEVEWGDAADTYYPAELVVHAYDRQGLLRDVTSVLADEKISIDNASTSTDRRHMQAVTELRISVPGLAALCRVISKLEQLPNVTSVRRKN
jgi:GTP pyrophosphokinase